MSTEANLKKLNAPYLWTFFIFNAVVFLGLFFAINYESIMKDFKSMLTFRSLGILVAPLILFVLNGILSSNQKAILVFWRVKHPLPGSRAFSVHGRKDTRIDINRLEQLYGTLPVSPEKQNSLWYKIYRKNFSEVSVYQSQKDFLLARDLASMAFLYIAFAGLPMLFLATWPSKLYYLFFLIAEYLVLVLIAQNHGRCFVTNVLAVESVN
jgi:hypothetical protein